MVALGVRVLLFAFCLFPVGYAHEALAAEDFVIAASPSLARPLEALAKAFEERHPDVRVKLYFDSGLDLRQTIASMENSMVGQYFIGTGPIHLVAPGGDELLVRLEQRNYVLPGTKRAYAVDQLVLVVPESLVESPNSLEEMSRTTNRLAVADSSRTRLGVQTSEALQSLGLHAAFKGRLDVATDFRGVIDHVLSGQADAGIVYGNQAVKERERLRVAAIVEKGYLPTVHSMAMERYCPNRRLCEEFLTYIQSGEAEVIVRQTGYGVPKSTRR